MSHEGYLENGPLHGKVIILKDLRSMNLNGGFYMLDEKRTARVEKHRIPWFTWVDADDRVVVILIGGKGEEVTVHSARLDRDGLMHLRLCKSVIEQELYQFWKETAEQHVPAWVDFLGRGYKGFVDLVGKNDGDGYMFLQFAGKITPEPVPALSRSDLA